MSHQYLWDRFKGHCCSADDIGLRVDVSHMRFGDEFLSSMESRMQGAFSEMADLESGAMANSDEGRMVGHYWLRAPRLAPTTEITRAIQTGLKDIRAFASSVHGGETTTADGKKFTHLLSVGIGGSALGPQFVADALGGPGDKITASFIDNTDPDGIDRTLDQLGERLATTLVLVISKSGGTIETQNGMLEVKRRFEQMGLAFERHAIAITGAESKLDRVAQSDGWLKRFEMWDWVGGRTSELSAVGLVPAALQGYDIDGMLAGASACDQVTRVAETGRNPAALLALMWYYAGQGSGAKDMVVLPYKDRLALFGKYLQQLVMESLGKKTDRGGKTVHQGLTVYGNKGSTDQHAYVQQLRDGSNGFFVTFVEVLRDRDGESMFVQPGFTAGDYLHGFLQGTRRALDDAGRESITITVNEISPWSIGVLIALFERAVGLYASLININAYHQPGVEAGKKAAGEVIEVQSRLTVAMQADPSRRRTAQEWASLIDAGNESETVFGILEHLAANADRGVARVSGSGLFDTRYGAC